MKIKEVTTIEPCRDGGTVIATFTDVNDIQYSLEFRRKSINGATIKYNDPVLVQYKPSIYESKVTGIKQPTFEKSEKEISWLDSKNILRELKPLIKNEVNIRLDIFNSMLNIIENEGETTYS